MAALLDDRAALPGAATSDRQICGGALVAPSVVLTAAHCVTEESGGASAAQVKHVVIGRVGLDDAGGEVLDVDRVDVHPRYRVAAMSHDLALLHLAHPSSAVPATIATEAERLREGQPATVMGWGRTREDGAPSPVLLRAELPLWSSARCAAAYAGFPAHHERGTEVCAAPRRGGRDACQGDSGGPLMLGGGRRAWRLLGVVSWGAGCARPNRPTNFSWVASPHLHPWLLGRIAALEHGDPDTTAPAIAGLHGAARLVRYTVSEPAETVFTLRHRDRLLATALVQHATAGPNSFLLPRDLHGRRLRAGTYVVRAVATDAAGNTSTAAVARLRIA